MEQADAPPRSLDEYRAYLRLLARAHADRQAKGAVDPSDLVQECLVRALAAREGFRGGTHGEFAAWLRSILARVAADAARRRGRRDERLASDLAPEVDGTSIRPDARLAADWTLLPDRAIAEEGRPRFALALEAPPEGRRRAVELRHPDGLSVPEVAARLGRTRAAVAVLIRRGPASLRRDLGADGPPGTPP